VSADLYGAVGQLTEDERRLAAMEEVFALADQKEAEADAWLAANHGYSTRRRDVEREREDARDVKGQLLHGWSPMSPGTLRQDLAARGVNLDQCQVLAVMRRRVGERREHARQVRDALARREAAAQV
jgi:hypothetical protein